MPSPIVEAAWSKEAGAAPRPCPTVSRPASNRPTPVRPSPPTGIKVSGALRMISPVCLKKVPARLTDSADSAKMEILDELGWQRIRDSAPPPHHGCLIVQLQWKSARSRPHPGPRMALRRPVASVVASGAMGSARSHSGRIADNAEVGRRAAGRLRLLKPHLSNVVRLAGHLPITRNNAHSEKRLHSYPQAGLHLNFLERRIRTASRHKHGATSHPSALVNAARSARARRPNGRCHLPLGITTQDSRMLRHFVRPAARGRLPTAQLP